MQDYTERRKHERIEVVKAIFIEVIRSGSKRESENTIIRCETVDISVSGLRIHIPQQIPQGSRLNIAVPMDDWKENLELVGQAVWVRPVENGSGFWVGLELGDSSRDTMHKWFKVVHSLSSTPCGQRPS
ncbi:MAG: PilZ domain-containing protein [Halioglobus sp.]